MNFIKKTIPVFILLLCVSTSARSQAIISDFSDDSVPVMNDKLLSMDSNIRSSIKNYTNLNSYIVAYGSTASGHDHDGIDSKKVVYTNLDMTGITDGHILYNNAGVPAGKAETVVTVKTILTTSFKASSTNDVYLAFGSQVTPTSTSADHKTFLPIAGTIKNFAVSNGTDKTITAYIYKNNSSSGLTISDLTTGQYGLDSTHTASIAAGDYIAIVLNMTSASGLISVSLEFDPS